MNILPKKRWHVRNQDNKERVRRDEENAKLEEKKEQERISLAEQEARLRLLRKRTSETNQSEKQSIEAGEQNQHINLFIEEENAGEHGQKKDNKEYIKEKNAEKESQHKRIGLLTYLGQTSLDEKRGNKIPWYLQKRSTNSSCSSTSTVVDTKDTTVSHNSNLVPVNKKHEEDDGTGEKNLGQKSRMDPMCKVEQHFKEKRREHKQHKKHKKQKKEHTKEKKSKSKSIEQLRAERLQRESSERKRSEQILSGSSKTEDAEGQNKNRARYNNQYVPHLSRDSKSNERWKPY